MGLRVILGVSEKVAVAELAEVSEALMVWLPLAAAGALKVTLMVPVAVAVVLTAGVRAALSQVIATGALGAKPLPVTVICVPTVPVVGVMLIWATTVRVVVAVLVPSETVTVCAPAAMPGMVKLIFWKEPLPSVVGAAGLVVTVLESTLTVIGAVAAKPVPPTITVAPGLPEAGVSVILGPTVKVAPAEPYPSCARMVWGPSDDCGMLRLALKPPVGLVVIEEGEVVTPTPSKVMETESDAPKPVPVTLTLSPTPPEAGTTVILGLTVKATDALSRALDTSIPTRLWVP